MKIKNALRGTTKFRFTFSEIRKAYSSDTYPTLIKEVYFHPFYGPKIFSSALPKTIGQLKRVQPLNSAGLDKEVLWATALVQAHSRQITQFIVAKLDIQTSILQGNYDVALRRVHALESELGVSLWSTSLKLFLTRELHGSEAQNALLKDAYNSPGINGYTYYLVYYLKVRSEGTTPIENVIDILTSQTPTPVITYIQYKLAPFNIDQHVNKSENIDSVLEAILRNETNSSIFDLYETLLRVCQLAAFNPRSHLSPQRILECVKRLSSCLREGRINHLGAALDPDWKISHCENTARVLDALDLILSGQLVLDKSSLERVLESLFGAPTTDAAVGTRVQRLITQLIESNFTMKGTLGELQYLCSVLSDLDPVWTAINIARRLWHGSDQVTLFGTLSGALNCGAFVPDIAEFLPNVALASGYLQRLSSVYGERPSILYQLRTILERPLPEAFFQAPLLQRWFDVTSKLNHGLDEAFVESIGSIDEYDGTLFEGTAKRRLIRALVRLGRLEDAVDLAVASYLKAQSPWRQLPVSELADACMQNENYDKSNLAFPILFDMHVRFYETTAVSQRAFAVEDAWESLGVRRPSDIPRGSDRLSIAKTIYYFRFLCVPSILEESDSFQSARELDDERIRICQLLVELDQANSETYQAEIKGITRRLIIYDSLRRIEQSKIYVDVKGLLSALIPSVAPEYERMMLLQRDRSLGSEISEISKRDLKLYRDDELTGQIMLNLQEKAPRKILEFLVLKIWDAFASDSHYGLDVYLSTRIRHGTLIGHLRSPLEQNHLACQREANQYKDQPYWAMRCADLPRSASSDVQQLLKRFSEEIDTELATLNGRDLRVQTGQSGSGWFDFRVRLADVNALERVVTGHELPVEEFVIACLQILWTRLGYILEAVRGTLTADFRNRWRQKFGQLREGVHQLPLGEYRAELDAAIVRAQAASDTAIDRVASWFTLSSTTENPDYTLDLAVDIASKSIQNCFGHDSVAVIMDADDPPMLRGSTLASLVDVFFILLENAVRHARPPGQHCKVQVSLKPDSPYYSISVKNELANVTDRSLLRDRVKAIKESLNRAEEWGRVAREGGTGFHKLRKIVSTDLGLDNEFDFEISDDDIFLVTIIFDPRRILA